jgi:23S rRNA (cytosine1962-C5)-methyltransferase
VPGRGESSPPTRAASRPVAAPVSAPAGAIVSRRAADRLRSGYLWVYASDVLSIVAPKPDESLIVVADQRGIFLGTALSSPQSQIALRMVSREELDQTGWIELLGQRLRRAIEWRLQPLVADNGTDSCRLCFSEADELPGLVIDKYGDLVIVQLLAKGLDSPAVRRAVVDALRSSGKIIEPAAIWERPDPRIRELEGLAAPNLEPLYAADSAQPKTATVFHLNKLKFHFDVNSGQKTGAFLDQRANYRAAKEWAWLFAPGGRALDVCTYQGGFALHLAQVCGEVTGIDASHASLEVAEKNLAANRDLLGEKQIEWVCGDAFDVLRDWSQTGKSFDVIVLDPPAFAKSKRAVEGALRGYKELNLRALKMLRPGGLLVTCSCSHHVSWADLEASVAAAAADASRRVRLLERRGAAPDHPVVLNLPETEYLKCLVLEVE